MHSLCLDIYDNSQSSENNFSKSLENGINDLSQIPKSDDKKEDPGAFFRGTIDSVRRITVKSNLKIKTEDSSDDISLEYDNKSDKEIVQSLFDPKNNKKLVSSPI